MATINQVADEMLAIKGSLTTKKLQKLVYYANAVHLVRTGFPLFSNNVEAFDDGPVVYPLFKRFQGRHTVNNSDMIQPDYDGFESSELDAIRTALALYGDRSADWLINQTHIEAPWLDARSAPGNLITSKAIRDYYQFAFDDPEVDQALLDAQTDDGLTAEEFRDRYLSAS